MHNEIIIETERLVLRKWWPKDLYELASIFGNKEVMHYFPRVLTKEETKRFMTRMNEQIETRAYGYFAAELQKSQQLIGFTGLSYQEYEADFTPCVDIGWRLHPRFWNYGLASEAAQACIEYAFAQAEIHKIYAITPSSNEASIAVMKKIGLKYEYSFSHSALVQTPHLNPCVLYSILKSHHGH